MADKDRGIGRTVEAREIMSTPVLTAYRSATVSEAAALMLVNRVGSIVIIEEDGAFAGMLTERMLVPEEVLIPFMRGSAFKILGHEVGNFENLEETMDEVRGMIVGDVMSTSNPVAAPDTHLADLTELMVTRDCHHICILDNNRPVGMVSRHDLLRLLLKATGEPLRRAE